MYTVNTLVPDWAAPGPPRGDDVVNTGFRFSVCMSCRLSFWINFKGVVTNYGEGGATKREGGAREVLPLRKGGAEKVLAMLKGGHKKFWGRLYAVA